MTSLLRWVVFHSCKSFRDTNPLGYRPWPDHFSQKYKKQADSKLGEFWFLESDPTATTFATEYRQYCGADPYSHTIPVLHAGREMEHPFFFFPATSKKLVVADGITFDRQLDCGNPLPDFMARRGFGCGEGKDQIEDFLVAARASLPKTDFFQIDAAPRLNRARIFGVSARVADLFGSEKLRGVEMRPILRADRVRSSNLFQVTVIISTNGVFELNAPLDNDRHCSVCGYHFGSFPEVPAWHRTYAREFFADADFQVGDLIRCPGSPETLVGGENPVLFVSARVIRLVEQYQLTGLVRASRRLRYWPVSVSDVST